MTSQLEVLVKSLESLKLNTFEDNLDFLGSYSGLTAYNFTRHIEQILEYNKEFFSNFTNLRAIRVNSNELSNTQYCYAFLNDGIPILSLVFEIRNDKVFDIKDGYEFISDLNDYYFCNTLNIYKDEKEDYQESEAHKNEKIYIKNAIEELYTINSFHGIFFEYAYEWYFRYKNLGNLETRNNEFYRFKEEISLVLNELKNYIEDEIQNNYTKIKTEIAQYFNLNSSREKEIFDNILKHEINPLFNNFDTFFDGYKICNHTKLKLIPVSLANT